VPLQYGIPLVNHVFPVVDRELGVWAVRAGSAGPELREQALSSITHKRFHCLGGSVYSLWPKAQPAYRCVLLRLIVAFQTMSDYLDNLCDRTGVLDDCVFRRLHASMLAALDMGVEASGFYAGYPHEEDGGYLKALVLACRREVAALPHFHMVRGHAIDLVRLYIDLQVHKHTHGLERVRRLSAWHRAHLESAPETYWWEFAAASGSTLGVFALFAAASQRHLRHRDVEALLDAYFPYVAGLHILLDYLIDQKEDDRWDDLNLVSYYQDHEQRRQRMHDMLKAGLEWTRALPDAGFHHGIVLGLLAMYMTDPKIAGGLHPEAHALLGTGAPYTTLMRFLCACLRKRGRL
jgi:tetraprenyl-beta-curcumene synthase